MPLLALILVGVVLYMSASKSTKAGVSAAVGYLGGKAVKLTLSDIGHGGKQLSFPAAFAFLEMEKAANADGVTFQVNSAFRTMQEQDSLYAAYRAGTGNLAAPPGYSNHQNGIAVDIDSAADHGAAFNWLTANADRFHFRRTVPSEPWHWEFYA